MPGSSGNGFAGSGNGPGNLGSGPGSSANGPGSSVDKRSNSKGPGFIWSKNSCYMDASLFALFAYSTVLKKILFDPSGQEHEARRVLNSIVTTLQNGEVVSEQQTTELR